MQQVLGRCSEFILRSEREACKARGRGLQAVPRLAWPPDAFARWVARGGCKLHKKVLINYAGSYDRVLRNGQYTCAKHVSRARRSGFLCWSLNKIRHASLIQVLIKIPTPFLNSKRYILNDNVVQRREEETVRSIRIASNCRNNAKTSGIKDRRFMKKAGACVSERGQAVHYNSVRRSMNSDFVYLLK